MWKRILALSAAALFCAGCAGPGAADVDGRLAVCASFYPMADFAAKVGGDRVRVSNMLQSGGDPHDWEPTPADMAALATADVFIYNGAGMEHWVDTVLASLNIDTLMVVCASEGIDLLAGHDHGEDGHGGEEEDDNEGQDAHVWLSIANAKKEMENIKNALAQADPENAAYFEENFRRHAQDFDALDSEFRDTLAALPRRDIVVSHQAFGYLCRDYGLNQTGIEGLLPHSEPDPATMSEVARFVRDNDVKVIFYEENASPKVAEAVARETGAAVEALNNVSGLTDEQAAAGEDYLSVMRTNLEALKRALE